MKFGAHVSIAGGIQNAPKNAHDLGCECFQIFSRSPRGGKAPVIDAKVATEFKKEMKKYKMGDAFVHTPYYINFASSNNRIRFGSINVVREELERASLIGAKAVMTHIGSFKDYTKEVAMKKTISGLAEMLKDYKGSAKFLLEISAGSGQIIGSTFEELKEIRDGIIKIDPRNEKHLGICFDTAHAFASGYDLKNDFDKVMKEFDKIIGLEKIRVLHLNDSKVELNKKADRHEHIGQGFIGAEVFKKIVKHPNLSQLDAICETKPNAIKEDLKLLKSYR
ncbi:MAG: deoxyribonuclease IV [bacterium]